jgi:hypothetical protein
MFFKTASWQIQLLQQLNTNVALNQSIDEILATPILQNQLLNQT